MVERYSTREQGLEGVLARLSRPYRIEEYVERVRPIVEAVAREGYEAVKRFSQRFDGVSFDDPRVGEDEEREALAAVGEEVLRALETAARAVRAFQEAVKPEPRRVGGVELRWLPVERVGVYAPAGGRPYPSTVIMTVVPARVAGSRLVVVATPPSRRRGFKADPLVTAAARVAGADAVYAVGGAQAVAGLAFGAAPLPRVDLIAGPGGPYVEAAKLLASSMVGIDLIAGPTELAVVADDSADPELVALDMLAQAEHGPLSTVLLATPSGWLASEVEGILRRAPGEGMGRLVIAETRSLGEAAELVDRFAPEHLEVLARDPGEVLSRVGSAGAVTVGVPAALLDYALGPSHVLPTGGSARWRGGLSVYDFLKPVAVASGIPAAEILEAAITLARAEGFEFHARSLEARRS
ncbi:histidinol dehydrogenase [Stetteria hydrogenophila]